MTTDTITYQELTPRAVMVRLGGKIVGTIKTVGDNWAYFPLGKRTSGEVFPSLAQCKASLEAE